MNVSDIELQTLLSLSAQEMLDPSVTKAESGYLWRPRNILTKTTQNRCNSSSASSTTSSVMSTKSLNDDDTVFTRNTVNNIKDKEVLNAQNNNILNEKSHIQILCETMKRQIISRAFYGWLAYCRHLRTVRTHLAGLVCTKIVKGDEPTDASSGLSREKWLKMQNEKGQICDPTEVYRLIYFGGVDHGMRKTVWPFLLGHHRFEDTEKERQLHSKEVQQQYELTMSEWLAVEAIVKQRDKEIMTANLAKLSSESTTSAEIPLTGPKADPNSSLNNDVFEESSDTESEVDITDREKVIEKKVRIARKKLLRHKTIEAQRSQNIIVTNPSIDSSNLNKLNKSENVEGLEENKENELNALETVTEKDEAHLGTTDPGSQCPSPASSNGGVYSVSESNNMPVDCLCLTLKFIIYSLISIFFCRPNY